MHYEDVQKLIDILNRLVNAGNTVVLIEHNMDIIKVSDHVIDLGPEGGEGGGRIVVEGTPEYIISNTESHTARFLKLEM